MQFSENWLRSLCNPSLDSAALCHLLTMAGLEVEEVHAAAPAFTGVVVAQIVAFEKHPNADRLRVCTVDAGQGAPLQIVCGAPNVEVGMKAPCAIVGAKLPGFEIKPAKLRGVESFGMMCSADELGMTQAHDGLLVLPADAPVGQDIRQYLALDDNSIVIKLTPNRPDCLSLAGIARELSALTDAPLQLPQITAVPATADVRRAVVLDAPQACPRYFGRVLRNVDTAAPTPDWMRQRLERCGVRSISIAVDVTNYVMLELGQPLHAFDDDKLQGAIHVRLPKQGECLTLLNGQDIEPAANMLLIADEARALALAGVMGGADSGVQAGETRNIFLESAFFQPDWIVGRARALNFSSDASHRFERGVDPELAARAIERATALILEICGGEAGPVVEAVDAAQLPKNQPVRFRPERARRVLGVAVTDADMRSAFERLALQVSADGDVWQVVAPSYRFDIAIEEDLIEEIARVVGYDNIPALPPQGPITMLPTVERKRPVTALRHLLAGRDYQEVISYAFVEEAWERDFAGNAAPIKLANPIASQMSVMRSSLIGGLVGALASNIRHRATRVRLFEIGRCFLGGDASEPVAGYRQPQRVAALAWGGSSREQWGVPARKVDFYDVKADLEVLLGGDVDCRAAVHPALHPGRCAEVLRDGKAIGVLGELHPALVQKYELVTPPVVFELELGEALSLRFPQFREIARFPAVERDIALVVDAGRSVGEMLAGLRAGTDAVLRSVEVFDVYSGKGIEPGFKSVALRIVLQHTDRTLEDAEADSVVGGLVARAAELFGAHLRA
ncbi:MAG: phenylalanine--tRNA ligase subunit beta [Moraxellaceae bacterium]|nr:phenylalanine--tRNA ligase subunit beta [Moraxellaceae bacterium]